MATSYSTYVCMTCGTTLPAGPQGEKPRHECQLTGSPLVVKALDEARCREIAREEIGKHNVERPHWAMERDMLGTLVPESKVQEARDAALEEAAVAAAQSPFAACEAIRSLKSQPAVETYRSDGLPRGSAIAEVTDLKAERDALRATVDTLTKRLEEYRSANKQYAEWQEANDENVSHLRTKLSAAEAEIERLRNANR